MTPKEFFDKVVEMRRCQKEYFKNKRQIDLRISKQIEREVDEEIERVQKILHNKQNPQLYSKPVYNWRTRWKYPSLSEASEIIC